MRNFLKNTLFISLLPWAFLCFQYNQCHGYFAESYEALFFSLGVTWLINIFLSLLKLPTKLIVSLWFVLVLPNLGDTLIIDVIYKVLIGLTGVFVLKKIPFNLIKILLTIVLGINLFQIIQRDFSARKTAQNLIKNIPINKNFSCDKNIYWIVCDAYASADVLRQYYHFDNEDFYNSLHNLGFLTPDGQLPYTKVKEFPTLKALNFYTNFNQFDVTKENALMLHYCLKYNAFFNHLRQNGYTFLATPIRFPFLHKLNDVKILGETITKRHEMECMRRLNKFVEFIQKNYRNLQYLSQITPQIAHHYLRYEQGRGIAPKTYNDILKLLRSAFEQLREDGQNPFKKIPTQESETIFRKPYTEEELQQILMVSENHPFIRPIIVLGIMTAMRRGDCCLLKWEDVDLRSNFIKVKTSKTGAMVEIPI